MVNNNIPWNQEPLLVMVNNNSDGLPEGKTFSLKLNENFSCCIFEAKEQQNYESLDSCSPFELYISSEKNVAPRTSRVSLAPPPGPSGARAASPPG